MNFVSCEMVLNERMDETMI